MDFLMLFEGSPSGRKKLASLCTAPSEKGATWNVLVRWCAAARPGLIDEVVAWFLIAKGYCGEMSRLDPDMTDPDDQPRDFTLPSNALSSSALDSPADPRRKECPVALAPSFTANNRYGLCKYQDRHPWEAPRGETAQGGGCQVVSCTYRGLGPGLALEEFWALGRLM
ncbi:hypothetical protein P7K49_012061 [Saguinus oedipus]|uniref:Uncharacterized protein n=1 Tax=Saguinus oedipus TaxID=9490 RepID=A0ABQ9VTZ3_SAGOE|nr:hypothetical protein P7K49_012061 [Saguinus oedipus]